MKILTNGNDKFYTNKLIEIFSDQLLSENEKHILKTLLSNDVSQEEIDELFNDFDIETATPNKILIIENYFKSHPELSFNQIKSPAIISAKNQYMQNRLRLFVHLEKVGKEFNKINVKPMLIKGGAMTVLNPDLLRTMSDIDILVPQNAFEHSKQIAQKLGYEYKAEPHSLDFHSKNSKEGAIDVHKYIYMDTKVETNLNEGLFERASEFKFLDYDFLIPSFEDLLFISLVNFARNLRNATSSSGLIYTFFDCKFILDQKPDFNWEIVFNNAKITKTETALNFSVHFMKTFIPEIFADKGFELDIEKQNLLEEYSLKVLYFRVFLNKLRQKSRKMKIKKLFTGEIALSEYIKLKPKYFILKLVKNFPIIIKKIMSI